MSEGWRLAEAFTASWLEERGWRILRRNYRWRRMEVDLIAGRKDEIAFVEVKMASDGSRTMPLAKIDPDKCERLSRVAAAFLSETGENARCRFDVAVVRGNPEGFRMEYLPHAFRPEGTFTV